MTEVEDIDSTPSVTPQPAPKPVAYRPLVVGIDDSFTVLEEMRSLFTPNQYRFLGISDATHVLLTLLEVKPGLIFLDLVMPIVNGYEICAQIRRIPHFENTPITILTSQDTLVDRLRAKMVGATDFLSKPLVVKQVNEIAQKYL
ncbi:MAG: response regulator [Jaaginema sp. PMC 1079.18]|nr:response regulator [Jaaginema sp. PMC 1080.18]MEC4850420.1 response regulator [Jaaginema sp. PMC 1079.18]MEC4866559.1 response regulator [Jaaginema sp. PMC 1078.18]